MRSGTVSESSANVAEMGRERKQLEVSSVSVPCSLDRPYHALLQWKYLIELRSCALPR
jgi:hypothetical protein